MAQDLWNKDDNQTYDNGYQNVNYRNTRQGSYGNAGNTWQNASNGTNGYGGNFYGTKRSAAPFEQGTAFGGYAEESLSSYIGKTFLWMFAGLLLTFVVAYGMAASGMVYRLFATAGTAALIVITIAEFAVVIAMTAGIRKMAPAAAAACFLIYAALTGVTFSMYFVLFDLGVLVLAFGVTALFFGGMAAASLIFKMELDSIRPFLFGGLILLLVFGVLSIFLNLGAFNTLICYLGIAVFLGYTAYDVSKIRADYAYYAGQGAMLQKASIFSALQLYLDFINLFLYILRILGKRK